MKRQISCFGKVVVPFVVAAAALWTSPRMAVAQTPGSFSVNFEKIRFEYSVSAFNSMRLQASNCAAARPTCSTHLAPASP